MSNANSNKMKDVIKRINLSEIEEIRAGDLSLCKQLRFFMQYPETVREKLLEIAEHVQVDQPNVKIYEQGEHSDSYYVLIRGTVKIEQKHLRYAGREGMPPVVIRTCYDGD